MPVIEYGLGNVDNTSDIDKPVSTAQQEKFDAINSNLDTLEDGEVAGGKNLLDLPNPYSITCTYAKYIREIVK